MDRQVERSEATRPDIIERTGAAPPGTPPPSASRTADLTEPRPAGGVFDSSTAARADQFAQHDRIVARLPARPPDKAAAQSDQMKSEARESGPSSLEDTKQNALRSGRPTRTRNVPQTGIPQVTTNRKAGNDFRDELAAALRAAGRDVKIEVYKPTPYGGRYMDLDVWMNGKNLGGIEAKVGGSRYISSQRLKDWWLKHAMNYTVHVVRDR